MKPGRGAGWRLITRALRQGAIPRRVQPVAVWTPTREAVPEEPTDVYACPGCRQPVAEHEGWLAGQEGLPVEKHAPPGIDPDEQVAWGRPVRFHPGHYSRRIGVHIYRLTD